MGYIDIMKWGSNKRLFWRDGSYRKLWLREAAGSAWAWALLALLLYMYYYHFFLANVLLFVGCLVWVTWGAKRAGDAARARQAEHDTLQEEKQRKSVPKELDEETKERIKNMNAMRERIAQGLEMNKERDQREVKNEKLLEILENLKK